MAWSANSAWGDADDLWLGIVGMARSTRINGRFCQSDANSSLDDALILKWADA